ncbi:MAG: hypothetical protein WD934_10105, partial [Gemmatimonadales bacterium]
DRSDRPRRLSYSSAGGKGGDFLKNSNGIHHPNHGHDQYIVRKEDPSKFRDSVRNRSEILVQSNKPWARRLTLRVLRQHSLGGGATVGIA